MYCMKFAYAAFGWCWLIGVLRFIVVMGKKKKGKSSAQGVRTKDVQKSKRNRRHAPSLPCLERSDNSLRRLIG